MPLYALLMFVIIISINNLTAQQVVDLDSLEPSDEYENIRVEKQYTDSLASSFVIWVKNEVKAHYHARHTEHVYVLDGEGIMQLDGKEYKLKPGVLVIIPPGTIHSVNTTSARPLKVLSIQSPEFTGKDRHFVD